MANRPNRIILLLDRKEYISSEFTKGYDKKERKKVLIFDTSESVHESYVFTKKQANNTEFTLKEFGIDCVVIPTNIVREVITISYGNVSKRQVSLQEYSELKSKDLIFESKSEASKRLIHMLEKKKLEKKNNYERNISELNREIENIYNNYPELKRDLMIDKILGDDE